jgi:hypothetical protein
MFSALNFLLVVRQDIQLLKHLMLLETGLRLQA